MGFGPGGGAAHRLHSDLSIDIVYLATFIESMVGSISQHLLAAMAVDGSGKGRFGRSGDVRDGPGDKRRPAQAETVVNAPIELQGSVHQADLERLVAGDHHDPHQILGPHLEKGGDGRVRVVIREIGRASCRERVFRTV